MGLLDFLAQPSTVDLRGALRNIPVRKGGILPLTEYGDGSARLDWTAGVPGSIMEAFTAPARAYRGEIAPDQMIPEGLNFAGTVALGSAGVPRPRASVGMGGKPAEVSSHLDMSPEATPTVRGYHGASSSYEGDIYNPRRSQYRAFFAAESPELANNFARSYGDAPRVYPVDMELKKTFDASNPAHGDAIVNAFDKGGLFDRNYLMGSDTIRTMLRNGDAGLMEDPGVRRWLQRRGYDSWKFEDTAAPPGIDNRTSYGVLKPGRVRDLAGNVLFSNPETSAAPGLGLMAAAKQAEQPKGFTAYHGSPHDFDKFDMSKIGTGEGAQAYGHGLYFADSEGVAGQYRNKLANRPDVYIDGEPFLKGGDKFDIFAKNDADRTVASRLSSWAQHQAMNGDAPGDVRSSVAHVREDLRLGMDRAQRSGDFDLWAKLNDQSVALDRFEERGIELKQNGKMYQVRINADPEHFLDWDKPLFLQSPAVKDSLRSFGIKEVDEPRGMPSVAPSKNGDKWTVRNVWGDAVGTFATKEAADFKASEILQGWGKGGAELAYQKLGGNAIYSKLDKGAASQKLRDAGIPGIKYLDQGSRAAGDGSRNYVVFDDKLIEILKKYGLLGMMGGGAALASGSGDANARGILP